MPVRFSQLVLRALTCAALSLVPVTLAGSGAARAQSATSENRDEAMAEGRVSLVSAVSYSPAERALMAQAEAGTLRSADLFVAALVAGGVYEPQEQRFYEARRRLLA